MNITFSGLTQPLSQYTSGAGEVSGAELRKLVKECERGVWTAPELTEIIEGAVRNDATFS